MFYEWLLSQRERKDDVGAFALLVTRDKHFPRQSHHLHVILRYCDKHPMLRSVCKKAHAEWRRVRDARQEEAR